MQRFLYNLPSYIGFILVSSPLVQTTLFCLWQREATRNLGGDHPGR